MDVRVQSDCSLCICAALHHALPMNPLKGHGAHGQATCHLFRLPKSLATDDTWLRLARCPAAASLRYVARRALNRAMHAQGSHCLLARRLSTARSRALAVPLHRKRLHQPRQRHPFGLPSIQDGLNETRRQQREPEQARDV